MRNKFSKLLLIFDYKYMGNIIYMELFDYNDIYISPIYLNLMLK